MTKENDLDLSGLFFKDIEGNKVLLIRKSDAQKDCYLGWNYRLECTAYWYLNQLSEQLDTRHAPQSVDVEGLKLKVHHSIYEPATPRDFDHVQSWNACLDYISRHYDIVKKSEG